MKGLSFDTLMAIGAGAGLTAVLLSCGAAEPASDTPTVSLPDSPLPGGMEWDDPAELDGSLYRTEVDGMPCIVWKQRKGTSGSSLVSYGGITCDWSER